MRSAILGKLHFPCLLYRYCDDAELKILVDCSIEQSIFVSHLLPVTDDFGPEPHELHEQVTEQIEEVRKELAKDRAEERRDRQWLNLIGLSTGILSALAAIAAMQRGYLATEGTLAQIKASDQWAFYQAQSTKRHLAESNVLLLQSLQRPVPAELNNQIQTLRQKQTEIQTEARRLQQEATQNLHRHEFFARSVASLQIAIS